MSYTIETQRGDVPSQRFGHTTVLVSESTVILFAGATGEGGSYVINNDLFTFDTKRFIWKRITPTGTIPAGRAAHASASVDVNQMVIYGGAVGGGGLCSEDLYLFDYRNPENPLWMTVPVSSPTPGQRYGHTMVYNRPNLIVFGGNDGKVALNDIWTMDAEKPPFSWSKLSVINPSKSPSPRVYHSAQMCTSGPASGMMVIFGGRNAENRSLRDTWGLRQHRDSRWDWVDAPQKKGTPPEARFQHSCAFFKSKLIIIGGRTADVSKQLPTSVYDTETCEWRDIASAERFRHSVFTMGSTALIYGGFSHQASTVPTADLKSLDLESIWTPDFKVVRTDTPQPVDLVANETPTLGKVTIAHEVYVALDKEVAPIRRIGIDTLEDEGKKMKNKLANVMNSDSKPGNDLSHYVISHLLKPTTWQGASHDSFFMQGKDLIELISAAEAVFKRQPTVLSLRAPIKVYGDIHGQFSDLMRLFERYGSPAEPGDGGDIDAMDYLFLGDYVDRGAYSLEVICLLYALKLKYPSQIHLIRGNHEDPAINCIYGFKDECRRRLKEDPDMPGSCWKLINQSFEYLPVGAIIEERVLCIHGGIGASVNSVADLEAMKRPLKVAQTPMSDEEQKVTDLLWSDPTDSDTVMGVTVNETRDPDGSGRIYKFGPDRVTDFLAANQPLSMIVRAHECVMDGFERFAGGRVITVFSATDYCGHHRNAGALLFIRRDLTIVPKLIYPVERTPGQAANWDTVTINQRPPTPPRAHRGEY